VSALQEVARAAGPALAPYRVTEPGGGRFDGDLDPDRAFVLEAVYEGYLLHYGEPRAFSGLDDDLRLLAGDSLYALGLARLADLGDLAAVAELADLISLCAWAEAEGRSDLVEGLWEASAAALEGRGPGARAALGDQAPAG
jgi:hypothetical protein